MANLARAAAVMKVLLLFVVAAATQTQMASSLKIYAAGAGNMPNLPESASEVIKLSGVVDRSPRVLYLGTASYDDRGSQAGQTSQFIELECSVKALDVAYTTPGEEVIGSLFKKADIIIVSGGNTLFAIDRWVTLGIDVHIREAAERGAVLAGGSAGAIVWFDGGHSDSMDPTTYKNPPGPVFNPKLSNKELMKTWAYVRVPGLGLLPGLFCPHYDATGSNGVMRSISFTSTLRHHTGELGVAVDNFAALMIDGDNYTLVSRDGYKGSVGPDGSFVGPNFSRGRPGGWKVRINNSDGSIERTLIPSTGKITELLQHAAFISESEMLAVARLQNPDDGKRPALPSARKNVSTF